MGNFHPHFSHGGACINAKTILGEGTLNLFTGQMVKMVKFTNAK